MFFYFNPIPLHHFYAESTRSVTYPVNAVAAAVYGEARYTWPSLDPIRPGKFLLVVDTHTRGGAGPIQPACSNI
ncbi:hypothetical protein Gasu2_05890 [Galdieria sulphuraria]|nr:hypothetical protein Gasu2_05890 [Galdieria sulphuraria]